MRLVGLGLCLVLLLAGCEQSTEAPGRDATGSGASAPAPAASSTAAAVPQAPQTVSVFDLAIGDCLTRPSGKALANVEVVACDQPHDMEVYGVYDIPQGPKKKYPGRKAVRTFAEETCRGVIFSQYVGVDKADSQLLALEATPVRKTWKRGDREVVCFAHAGTEQLTASVKDSKR